MLNKKSRMTVAFLATMAIASLSLAAAQTTTTTTFPVPIAWLEKFYPGTSDYEARAKQMAANGINTVEEAYVAGIDPTNVASVFTASVALSNGMAYVSWAPNLNTGGVTRLYKVWGRDGLETGDWESPFKPWYTFFKVTVALPTGASGETTAVANEGFKLEGRPLGGVQLWAGGPYWAECNVGAASPEESGYYFWWGDTVGYKPTGGTESTVLWSYYDWAEEKYWEKVRTGVTWVSSRGVRMSSSPFEHASCPTFDKTEAQLKSLGYVDSAHTLTPARDAARAHLGSPWRMPTFDDLKDLEKNCSLTLGKKNGVWGMRVTGRGSTYVSRSIFIPCAGCGVGSDFNLFEMYYSYWSSTFDSWYDPENPCPFAFSGSAKLLTPVFSWDRFASSSGRPVRAVRDCPK